MPACYVHCLRRMNVLAYARSVCLFIRVRGGIKLMHIVDYVFFRVCISFVGARFAGGT